METSGLARQAARELGANRIVDSLQLRGGWSRAPQAPGYKFTLRGKSILARPTSRMYRDLELYFVTGTSNKVGVLVRPDGGAGAWVVSRRLSETQLQQVLPALARAGPPARQQAARSNTAAAEEALARALKRFKPGYRRRKHKTVADAYDFQRRGASGIKVQITGLTYAGARLYRVLGSNAEVGILVRGPEADGTYSLSSRLSEGQMRLVKPRLTAAGRNAGKIDGRVPLYALLNSDTITDEDGRKVAVPRYALFDVDAAEGKGPWEKNQTKIVNRAYTLANQPRRLTANEQAAMAAAPPLCQGRSMDLRDQKSCFVQDLRPRLEPAFEEIRSGRAARDPCDRALPAKLQPHQRSVFELARVMAEQGMQKLNGYRGLLCWFNTGAGKCLAVDEQVMLFDGSLVRAGDLQPGMLMMGPDSTPRRVLDVGRGTERMYEIRPTKGEPWRCNESHILSLKYNKQGAVCRTHVGTWCVYEHAVMGDRGVFLSKTYKTREEADLAAAAIDKDLTVDIPLAEYLTLPKNVRHCLKQFRAGRVTFPDRAPPAFDPYVIGAWLGDGTTLQPEFTLGDAEIATEIARRVEGTGLVLSVTPSEVRDSCAGYRLMPAGNVGAGGNRAPNPFLEALRDYDLVGNKHIPQDIKTGSMETRLQVLAGLLDTDGHLGNNCYEITQKVKAVADDAAFVARSLGLAAYVKEVEKACVKPDGSRVVGTYYRVTISGEGLDHLPLVVPRKKAAPRGQIKDVRRTGFEVVPVGEGEYAGPVLDGDHRYLLADFTVTHNTVVALGIALGFWNTGRRILVVTTPQNEGDNNLNKYAENVFKFFPSYAPMVFKGKTLPAKPWSNDNPCLALWCKDENNVKELKSRIETDTFVKFASSLGFKGGGQVGRANPIGPPRLMGDKRYPEGSVLIMDEVQSLFTPQGGPDYVAACKYLVGPQGLYQDKYRQKMFMFALTATPGNTVQDMLHVLNLVRPLNRPMLTMADTGNPDNFRGLVSYVDIRSDKTRYGTKQVENLFEPMGARYYTGFLQHVSLTPGELKYPGVKKPARGAAEDEPPGVGSGINFLVKQRTAGNWLPAAKFKGEQLDLMTRQKRVFPIENARMAVVSEKLMRAIRNATTLPGKQYIWVADMATAKVAMGMLKAAGFAWVDPGPKAGYFQAGGGGEEARAAPAGADIEQRCGMKDADADKKPRKPLPRATPKAKAKGNKFLLYKKGQFLNREINDALLSTCAGLFNDKANNDGEIVKIMLATETFYQGLDMQALRGVHLVDSLFNQTADKQAVGRALRLCGHAGRQGEQRQVKVYRYFAVPPPGFDLARVAAANAAAGGKKRSVPAKAQQEIAQRHAAILKLNYDMAGYVLPEGQRETRVPPGVNAYVYADAVRRQREVDTFERGLKAFAVDCELFKDVYHVNERDWQCGRRPAAPASQPTNPAVPNRRQQPSLANGGIRPSTPNITNRLAIAAAVRLGNRPVAATKYGGAGLYAGGPGIQKMSFVPTKLFSRQNSAKLPAPVAVKPAAVKPAAPPQPPVRLANRPPATYSAVFTQKPKPVQPVKPPQPPARQPKAGLKQTPARAPTSAYGFFLKAQENARLRAGIKTARPMASPGLVMPSPRIELVRPPLPPAPAGPLGAGLGRLFSRR